MTILQLNPPIPVETKKGSGHAVALIDYSPENDLYWVVFIDDTCECWTFPNSQIRAQKNITLGRLNRPVFPEKIPEILLYEQKNKSD